MALTYSTMEELGAPAHPFSLPIANPTVDSLEAPNRSLDDYADFPVLVIVFTCNHCPYAIHVEPTLVDVAKNYAERGVQFVAISSNDAVQYPADSFDNMAIRAEQAGFPFPYLFDESQDVAKAYGAVCTPDFFIYNTSRTLVYRGRFDETRPGQGTAHGGDLTHALDALLAGTALPDQQWPSMGCNIKWR